MPWRRIVNAALSLWVATRFAYLVITYYYPIFVVKGQPTTTPIPFQQLVDRWANWDGAWYVHIARYGYTTVDDTAFFPLYPLLVHLVAYVTAPHWIIPALIVANLGALLAFVGVAALAAQIAPAGSEAARARLAVILFAAYPLAFFLVAAYADGLFAGLASLALVCGLRRQWTLAAGLGTLAALCRPMGIVLVLPFAWEIFQSYREYQRSGSAVMAIREIVSMLGALAAPVIGLAVYCLYLYTQFGDPLSFVRAESDWTRVSLSPLVALPLAVYAFARIPWFSPYQARVLLDLFPVVCALTLTALAARKSPVALTLYLSGILYIVISEPILHVDLYAAGGRQFLAATPLFAIATGALFRSEWALPAYLVVGIMLQAALAVYFLGNGFII